MLIGELGTEKYADIGIHSQNKTRPAQYLQGSYQERDKEKVRIDSRDSSLIKMLRLKMCPHLFDLGQI